jgi:hypothetical protein
MKATKQDDFWTDRLPLFTAQLPSYYTKPQKVIGRIHLAEERYFDGLHELISLKQKKGRRVYVMMQPYVLEPILTMTVQLYKNPKQYADQESPIGETAGTHQEGFREVQAGNAQAWYYPEEKTVMLWECFFDSRFRRHPLAEDGNMVKLWQTFEQWLLRQFPDAKTLATPFNDLIAHSIKEYQGFLSSLGYAPFAKGVFAKELGR